MPAVRGRAVAPVDRDISEATGKTSGVTVVERGDKTRPDLAFGRGDRRLGGAGVKAGVGDDRLARGDHGRAIRRVCNGNGGSVGTHFRVGVIAEHAENHAVGGALSGDARRRGR